MSFTAPALSAGQIRELALFVRGMRATSANQTRAGREHGAENLPASFALCQNQPNPFASSTAFRFDLPQAVTVRLEVFDLVGRRVATLRDAWTPAGRHSIDWNSRDGNGSPLRPGAYLYRITAGPFRAQRKLVILP
jgi:flagellar hook assembly protein FlgD